MRITRRTRHSARKKSCGRGPPNPFAQGCVAGTRARVGKLSVTDMVGGCMADLPGFLAAKKKQQRLARVCWLLCPGGLGMARKGIGGRAGALRTPPILVARWQPFREQPFDGPPFRTSSTIDMLLKPNVQQISDLTCVRFCTSQGSL